MSSDNEPKILSEQKFQEVTTKEQTNIKVPDFRSVYANNTAFNTSTFDFSMTFGEISGIQEGRLTVEQHTKVTMSPIHAKVFLQVLAQQISQFEQQFGEIKLPMSVSSSEEK
jgi:hypothetical protein